MCSVCDPGLPAAPVVNAPTSKPSCLPQDLLGSMAADSVVPNADVKPEAEAARAEVEAVRAEAEAARALSDAVVAAIVGEILVSRLERVVFTGIYRYLLLPAQILVFRSRKV